MKKFFVLISLLFLPILTLAAGESLEFSTEPQSVKPNDIVKITIRLKDGVKAENTIYFNPESSSATGEFSPSSGWTGQTYYISKNKGSKSFYYKDSSVGDFVITVSSEGLSSITQSIKVSSDASNDQTNTNTTQQTTTTTTTTATSTNTSSGSSHTNQANLSDYREEKKFQVGAGRERLATVKTPIIFEVSRNKVGQIENLFRWSFGDGTSAVGAKVYHAYQFPGRYNVVLNATIDRMEEATSRTVVVVTEPRIRLVAVNPELGYVEIVNDSAEEQNLNQWSLRSVDGVSAYYLPLDTIISPGAAIKIPLAETGLALAAPERITLVHPGIEFGPTGLARAEVQEVAALRQRLADLRRQLALAQAAAINRPVVAASVSAPAKIQALSPSTEAKNVVILKQQPSWAERIRNVIFN